MRKFHSAVMLLANTVLCFAGKDNSDSVLLIQMFSDSNCLPGLPSLTFQCSVTNNLHVQFDIQEHRRFPTAHEAGAALSCRVGRDHYHSENHPLVLSCCHPG